MEYLFPMLSMAIQAAIAFGVLVIAAVAVLGGRKRR